MTGLLPMIDDLTLRVTAERGQLERLRMHIEGLPPVVRAEEIGDLLAGPRDDSSSAGLPDDEGPRVHFLQIGLDDGADADLVRRAIGQLGEAQGIAVEFVDEPS